MNRFGVMLDMSRNAVMKPQQVKEYACILKKMGYNMIQLYTEDTYEVEGEPYFGYLRGKYTIVELKDIVTYCQSIGMEVIPCIQTLAHLNQIFRWREYQKIQDVEDILLVEEPRTYQLIENMFKSLRQCFTSEYVHIGMDEAHMLGLGKYLDKYGVQNRFEILYRHLCKVLDIAQKYDFKPIMWSDMFFRLANKGEYYSSDPVLTEEVRSVIPGQVGLVYWDYYHDDQDYYEKMMKAHLQADNEIWFAGGAWTWMGFASGNSRTLDTMLPAVNAAKKCGIDNILMTLWGDNGKECSFYAALPSLYAVRKAYEGENDTEKIKKEFRAIIGEDYDAMLALDAPNYVGGNDICTANICKHMFYSDPFYGFLDAMVKDEVSEEYEKYAKQFYTFADSSKNYGYLFESQAALCEFLAVKYDLGKKTRTAYRKGDKEELLKLCETYTKAVESLEKFYACFRRLWFTENKPNGFDVQDIRLGGLMQRLKSCRSRLTEYIEGTVEHLPELEEELLEYQGEMEAVENKFPCINRWHVNVSINSI